MSMSSTPEQAVGFNGDPLADSKSRRLLRRRCCVAILVVVTIVMTVLAVIVLKVKDPTLTLNRFTLEESFVGTAYGTPPAPDSLQSVSIWLTLGVAASLENPNYARAKFNATTTGIRYRGREVGVANGPPGSVGARSTLDFILTLKVMLDRMPGSEAELLADVTAGSIVLTTVTAVGVRVKVGLIKRHVDAVVSCNVTLSIAVATLSFGVTTLSVAGQTCDGRIWV